MINISEFVNNTTFLATRIMASVSSKFLDLDIDFQIVESFVSIVNRK